jgi:hypothetical protein
LIPQHSVAVADADLTPAQSRAIKRWARRAIEQVLASYGVDRRFQLILCSKWADFYKATHGSPANGTIIERFHRQTLEAIETQQIAPKKLVNVDAARKNARIYVGPRICALLAQHLPLPETVGDGDLAWALFVLAHEACHFIPGADDSTFQELRSHAEELEKAARQLSGPRLDAVASRWAESAYRVRSYVENLQQALSLAQEGLVHIWAFIPLLAGRLGYPVAGEALAGLVERELAPLGEGPYSLGVLLATVLLHQAAKGRRDGALMLARRLTRMPSAPFFLARQIDALRENVVNLDAAAGLGLFPAYDDRPEWTSCFFAGKGAILGMLVDAVTYAREHGVSPGWLFGIDTGVLTLERFAQWYEASDN